MLRNGVAFRAVAIAALIAATGCGKQPPDPLRLHLELAKSKIKVGEYPWYRFSVTNIGRKPIELGPFLCWQVERHRYLDTETPGEWYVIQIADASGRLTYANESRHPHFWTNECGGQTGCSCKVVDLGRHLWHHDFSRSGPEKPLRGGETFFATPSVVSPAEIPAVGAMRPSDMDPRIVSWAADDLPPARRLALAKQWEMTVERDGYLLGDPTFVSTMTAADVPYIGYPKALYPGYRVFDDIGIDNPGRYRMRIVFRPLGRITNYSDLINEIKNWTSDGGSFEDSKQLFEETSPLPKETRVFLYVSNWVTFDVEAPAFPEHYFTGKKFKSPCDKALNDWLRQTLRDVKVWEGDPPDKKLFRHSPKELPLKCRQKILTPRIRPS